jgi:phosphoglycolate phosphatase-like HAD superfamily hydrolase
MVMVGDQEADLRGAEEFGCQFVGLVRPDSEFGTTPTWRIHHLTELPEMLAVLESKG